MADPEAYDTVYARCPYPFEAESPTFTRHDVFPIVPFSFEQGNWIPRHEIMLDRIVVTVNGTE
jgi:hypothetical protein